MTVYQLLAYLAIAYYLGFFSFHMLFLVLGYRAALRWKKLGTTEETHRLSRSEFVPPVTLVAEPFYRGEEAAGWLDNLLSHRFPEMEVVVVFDVEEDETVQTLIKAYFLRQVDRVYRRLLEAPHPRAIFQSDDHRLTLALVEGVKRGTALNLAVNLARYPYIAVAGDGVFLEEDAMLRMVRPFMEGEEWVPAAMGVVLPLEMRKGNQLPPQRITRFSLMESLRVQIGYQAGVPYLHGPLTTYSPLLLFHKEDVLKTGGFHPDLDCMGAEMDMILRLHRVLREEDRPYRFVCLPQLVCRCPFPQKWSRHFRDARAKRRGLSSALRSQRDVLFNARYGVVGLLYLPAFWLFVHLTAVMGIAAYGVSIAFLALGKIGWTMFAVFLASALVYPAVVGVGAVFAARRELGILGGHGALLYGYALLTQLWFRQLTSLATLFVSGRGGKERK